MRQHQRKEFNKRIDLESRSSEPWWAVGVRQRPGGTARSRRRKEGSRDSQWGYVLGTLGTAALALSVKCPGLMGCLSPSTRSTSKRWLVWAASSWGCTDGLCKCKEAWFMYFFPLLTDACHCTGTQASSESGWVTCAGKVCAGDCSTFHSLEKHVDQVGLGRQEWFGYLTEWTALGQTACWDGPLSASM